MFQGRIVWSGEVEVFKLKNHPNARRCYAWAYQDDGKTQYTAFLELPPVSSPETAVRAALVVKRERKES
jgi:hypothetical protein